jgi:hypothetical protein
MNLGASGTCTLYVFDSDMEAHVNMQRGVTDSLDRETVGTVQRLLSVVGMLHELWSYG